MVNMEYPFMYFLIFIFLLSFTQDFSDKNKFAFLQDEEEYDAAS